MNYGFGASYRKYKYDKTVAIVMRINEVLKLIKIN